jgi:NAD(P)-dependent dehydrogenase (short-subunit alcohol dehydrogenase family)
MVEPAPVERLDGRVAIITGAGQGIGEGIARRYSAEGAAVVVAEVRVDTGQRVASELPGPARFVATDGFADGGGHINGVPWAPEVP